MARSISGPEADPLSAHRRHSAGDGHSSLTPRRRAGEHRRRWYPLDNTARLFPAVISRRFTTVFRISARLDRPVRLAALNRALARAWRRYPFFRVRLARGVFWHYLEECDPAPVLADDGAPCMEPPRYRVRRPLIVVRARGRRIAVEASHVLTDGSGALEFLRALLVLYAIEHPAGGVDPAELPQCGIHALEPPDPAESEYASRRYYRPRLPAPPRYAPAWHVGGARLPRGSYRISTLRYRLEAVRAEARSLDVSMTDLVLAVLVAALAERYHAVPQPRRRRRPIRVLVPVSLRPGTGSRTMRNFFVTVMVEHDQRLGRYEIGEIARSVHHQLRAELDTRHLLRQVTRNVDAERPLPIRLMPVPLKGVILRTAFHSAGERVNTASLSNLGAVSLPQSMRPGVAAVDFVPPPSPITGVNLAMISSGEMLSLTFGSMRREVDVERAFAQAMHALGLTAALVTNGHAA